MSIQTYDELADALIDHTKASEDAGRFINLAENEIFRRLRVIEMEKQVTLTAVSSVVSIPTGFVGVKRLSDVNEPEKLYEQTSPTNLFRRYEDVTGIDGGYFAIEGSTIQIRPKPGASTQYDLVYWFRPAALSDSTQTNEIFPEYSDLYYHLACSEAFTSRREYESAGQHRRVFEAKLQTANSEAERAQASGAMFMRPPVCA